MDRDYNALSDDAFRQEVRGFFKTRYPEHVLRAVRSLVARADPNARELSLMRAIAIEVVKNLERVRRGLPPTVESESSSSPSDSDQV